MNIFSKVTAKTLIKNRVRTTVTVIGIILSVAMITAVTTSVSSLRTYLQNIMVSIEGLWHGAFYMMEPEDAALLAEDPKVDSVAFSGIQGYARLPGNDELGAVPYLYILAGDETYYERIPIDLISGRMPESSDEIVLSADAVMSSVFPEHEELPLGSEITLELGERWANGVLLGRFDLIDPDEVFVPRNTHTYTIVGYCERPTVESYSNPAYICFTLPSESDPAPYYEAYWLLHDPDDTFSFQTEFADGKYISEDNRDYLMALGSVRYSSFYRVIFGMAAILIVLIMFGSVSLIYNAFSISVSERTKQFGLLSSVGATKKQLRRMVFGEAVTLSAVGIPLGILSGILGMAITFHFIGADLADIMYGSAGAALKMRADLPSVIIAALIGFVTVLISAWIPSRRATKVTAIEAIRQNADISVKPREVRISPLTYKLFGLEGAIAGKHFRRSRRRYRATVMSLFMSVVLFISASSFCRYLMDSVSGVFSPTDYELHYSILYYTGEDVPSTSPDIDAIYELLYGAEGVKEGTLIRSINVSIPMLTEKELSEQFLDIYRSELSDPTDENIEYYIPTRIAGLDERSFAAYCRELGLDERDYIGTGKVICCATNSYFNSDTERVELIDFIRDDLQEITISITDHEKSVEFYEREDLDELTDEELEEEFDKYCTTDHTLPVGFVAKERPMGLKVWGNGNMYLIMPMDEFLKLTQEYDQNLYFTSDRHEMTYESMRALLEENGYPTGGLDDEYAADESSRSIVMVVKVLSYGFIALISLISAANVFNTISTNVLLRRREFAILRSVGMTGRGLRRMMNYECLLYGTKSLIFGVPVAFFVTYLIFRSISAGYDIGFYLPWSAVAIAVGSVFLVVFATMMYSMSIVKRDNPIDALKNEVI